MISEGHKIIWEYIVTFSQLTEQTLPFEPTVCSVRGFGNRGQFYFTISHVSFYIIRDDSNDNFENFFPVTADVLCLVTLTR